jgi:Ala-tRNA(Pro) deacylase
MDCRERLEQVLRENGVAYEILAHDSAYTMPEVAAALHISGKRVAKAVVVEIGDQLGMVVVRSSDRVDLKKLRAALGKPDIRLAEEHEFAGRFPDCLTGAHPPFGNLYGLPVYLDRSLADQPQIVFRAGTYRQTMQMATADLVRLVQPTVGDFALRV